MKSAKKTSILEGFYSLTIRPDREVTKFCKPDPDPTIFWNPDTDPTLFWKRRQKQNINLLEDWLLENDRNINERDKNTEPDKKTEAKRD